MQPLAAGERRGVSPPVNFAKAESGKWLGLSVSVGALRDPRLG